MEGFPLISAQDRLGELRHRFDESKLPPYALLIHMFFKQSRITHQLPGEL